MKTEDILKLALFAGALYVLYQIITGVKNTASGAIDSVSTGLANSWLDLFPNPLPMGVLGNVVFPNGQMVALSNLAPMQNPSTGQVAVQYGGHVYALSPSDANGNWPATLIQ